jgi:ABC-type multidrug transport system permease subunit
MIKSRLFQTIVLSIYVGGLFCKFQSDYTNSINWHALTGFFFFLSINSVFISLTPVTLLFPQERNIFLKEESAKLYGVTPYFLSRNTVEIPYALIFPALQSLILYWFVGLSSSPGQFFTFFFIIYLMNFNGMSLGLLIGSMVKDARSVSAVSPILILPIVLFSGFFKNQSNLANWAGWIQYISPFKYGFSAFTQNEVINKLSLIDQLNFDVNLWGSIGCLIGLGFGFRLLSWFFLWKLRTKL